MGKVKVNLTSGSVVEKPLITCFQGASTNYIVLDNEKTGTMGLPIICISKINGNNLEKIIDQNEWGLVKENLKNIISGGKMTFLPVGESLNAPDDFFTQLTLPVASFDVLKSTYETSQQNLLEPKVADVALAANNAPIINNDNISPAASEQANIAPVNNTVMMPDAMAISAPVISPATGVNSMDTIQTPVSPDPVNLTEPVIVPPTINNESVSVSNEQFNNLDLEEIKNTFMKSCENMFNALVNKFQGK